MEGATTAKLPANGQHRNLKFVDLFAGLGGFNLALKSLGHTCVYASEINSELRSCYEKNFGITPVGDIRQVARWKVPEHDILCAGFPCGLPLD
jgi:DNA (cytosine-5)-methyltransferase 1